MKIAVLLHENDASFATTQYYLRLIVQRWQSAGHVVELVKGVKRFVPADVIVPHLDLTIMPHEYCQFLDRYPITLNRTIVDTSKSKVSTNRIMKGDGYDGPVIVKTDRNYGGIPEKVIANAKPSLMALPRCIFRRSMAMMGLRPSSKASWSTVDWIDPSDYPVFDSLRDVPVGVFENKNLIVEKFLPERHGDDYCTRICVCLGNRSHTLLLRSKRRVVKSPFVTCREEIAASPEIEAIRRRLGFDYGKLDYVERDGHVVLFDVNRTPTYIVPELGAKVANHLADGIHSMIKA